jgi:hypothetical protein
VADGSRNNKSCCIAQNKNIMNKKPASGPKNLSRALALIAFVAVMSAGRLAAQSPVTLPAKVDGDVNGLSVELTAVQKTNDTILVRFKYINTSDKEIQMYGVAGGEIQDKIYYIDAKNKKKYPLIRDSENNPISSALRSVNIAPGETKICWGKFPAPPSDVTAISVYIPGAPPFENVPIAQ